MRRGVETKEETDMGDDLDKGELRGDSGFMRQLGIDFEEMDAKRVTGWFDATSEHHQPWGLVHGGVFTSVIETFATVGAYLTVRDRGQLAVGVNNVTDFLRPHREGRVRVEATPIQQGRSQQLWLVVLTRDEDGATIARGQVRLQNIEAEES